MANWEAFVFVLRFAAADGDLPQLFHFGEQRLAGLLAQNLAQQHAEGTNVAPQRRLFDVSGAGFQFSQAKRPVLRFPEQTHGLDYAGSEKIRDSRFRFSIICFDMKAMQMNNAKRGRR